MSNVVTEAATAVSKPVTVLTKFRLLSAPAVDTPRLLAWATKVYRTGNKKERKAVIRVFVEGFNLTEKCVKDLLDKKVPYDVSEDNCVVFDYAAAET